MAYNNETEVETFLKEGIVAVKTISGSDKEIRLNPGQKSIHTDGSYEITVNQTVIESDAAWTGGHLVFQNEDIPTVFRKIERWFNVSIRYNPEEFSNETLYVNMKSGETLDKLLQIIDNAISIQINRNGDELTIAKK